PPGPAVQGSPTGGRRPSGPARGRFGVIASVVAGVVLAVVLGFFLLRKAADHGTVAIRLPTGTTGVTPEVDGEPLDVAALDEPLRLSAGEHELKITGPDVETE